MAFPMRSRWKKASSRKMASTSPASSPRQAAGRPCAIRSRAAFPLAKYRWRPPFRRSTRARNSSSSAPAPGRWATRCGWGRKYSRLKTIKDLAGKQIAYTAPGSVSNMLILMALKANGMTPQQVKLVPAGDLGANISAVGSGAVDAGFSDELIIAQNKELVRPLFMVRDVLDPRMMQTVMITTAEYAKAHADIIKGLVNSRREGLAYTLDHPDEAADITAKAYNNPHTDLFRDHIRELIKENYWSGGRLYSPAMNHMVEGLQITGQIKGDVDWPKYVDTSYLPADLRPTQ